MVSVVDVEETDRVEVRMFNNPEYRNNQESRGRSLLRRLQKQQNAGARGENTLFASAGEKRRIYSRKVGTHGSSEQQAVKIEYLVSIYYFLFLFFVHVSFCVFFSVATYVLKHYRRGSMPRSLGIIVGEVVVGELDGGEIAVG